MYQKVKKKKSLTRNKLTLYHPIPPKNNSTKHDSTVMLFLLSVYDIYIFTILNQLSGGS